MRSDIPVIRQLIEASGAYETPVVGVQPVSKADISKYSKPEHAYSDYAILGRYVLSSAIFGILKNQPAGYGGEIQLTDGINTLCAQNRVLAVDFEGKRYDAGNLKGYVEAIVDHALWHEETGDWLRTFSKDKVNGS